MEKILLSAALNFSAAMVNARIKPKPVVDAHKEEEDLKMMEETGQRFECEMLIKKIKKAIDEKQNF